MTETEKGGSTITTITKMVTNANQSVTLDKATLHGNELIQTPIGGIELINNYFDDDASKRLYDELDFQRVAQSYIWATPLVSMTTWRNPDDDPKKYQEKDAFVFQSVTNNVAVLLRMLDPDPAYYEKFKASTKMGRYGRPLEGCKFIENKEVEWCATAPRGIEYWQTLSEIINEEPVREVDKTWTAMLLPLGIEKGKPFNPDERQKTILLKGGAMGEVMARNFQVNPRFTLPYWKGTSWYKSFDFGVEQETETRLQLDERTTWFYEAVASSKGMVNPTVGSGQVYMTTKRDNKRNLLRADKSYKLHVPKEVPVGQFWSLTLYSENTRRAYDNGGTEIRSASLGSHMKDLKYNSDGSIDLFIGAKAPAGFEKNYMKTVGEDGWFVYFRLYAPLQPFFDKTFGLPDFEIVN